MYIDSHAHIDGPEFDGDRAEVIARFVAAGVDTVICIGSGQDLETPRRAIRLAENQPEVFATVGVHPHHAAQIEPDWWPVLEELARHPRVVAVGETGLDTFYDNSPLDRQERAFREFIEFARRLSLPVICHIRDAHDQARAILAEHRAAELGCVIHCFTGSPDDAARYVDMGMYLSFSGIVTFPGARNQPLREAVRRVPLDRLLIETDCPYLAPAPMRGQRNEPAFVVHTAKTVARELDMEMPELGRATTDNARRLFRLPAAR
jgi:TatD DNase family protein